MTPGPDSAPLRPHRLPAASLRAIARGSATAADLRLLRSAQRSRLLLVLRALLTRADRRSGGTAAAPDRGSGVISSAESAWQLLATVQQHAPDAVDTVIADPSVMSWALRLLRRLRGDTPAAHAPLWADLAQFHALAAAAALHAGVPAVVRVPAHRGMIWLPGTGLAGPVSTRRWSRAEIHVPGPGSAPTLIRGESAELRLRLPGDPPAPSAAGGCSAGRAFEGGLGSGPAGHDGAGGIPARPGGGGSSAGPVFEDGLGSGPAGHDGAGGIPARPAGGGKSARPALEDDPRPGSAGQDTTGDIPARPAFEDGRCCGPGHDTPARPALEDSPYPVPGHPTPARPALEDDPRPGPRHGTRARPPTWHPLPRLSPEGLRLDPLTPYRDFGVPLRAPTPLSPSRLAQWRSRVTGAAALLARDVPGEATAVRELVRTLIPRPFPAARGRLVASASSSDAFGAVALSLPYDEVQTAAVLVHETRHQQLNALLGLVPLLEETRGGSGAGHLGYSPWRSDPRPPQGVLHGVYAFAGVAGFWRAHREAAGAAGSQRAEFEFAVLREQVREGITGLLAGDALNPAGRSFVGEISALVAEWEDDGVSDEPARLAGHYCAARRAVWRVRHLAIGAADALRLATAWRHGHPPGALPGPVLRPRLEAIRTDTFGPLAWLRLCAPGSFARLSGKTRAEGAEWAVVAGDGVRARRRYAAWIAHDPHDPEAWIGSVLALPSRRRDPAAGLLLDRPELVAGVHQAITGGEGEDGPDGPDPLALAGWLARAAP
ncbi:HEXXH motif-containing putative peptide modification protein [Streptomyces sp. CAU 1734]|uniref:aKG-HExxH-type peptide beta-hydroxylase n=1 Tax=Streptomyces sp. CAU 1734 TaxID=3140360 RepID=UPI00325FF5C8